MNIKGYQIVNELLEYLKEIRIPTKKIIKKIKISTKNAKRIFTKPSNINDYSIEKNINDLTINNAIEKLLPK